MSYSELSVEERATIQIGHAQGLSLRRIASLIDRSPSTISREVRRNRDACGHYSARTAQRRMQARRQACRPTRKLVPGTERFDLIVHMLRDRLSPEQIAGKLRHMNIPSLRDAYVCRETIGGRKNCCLAIQKYAGQCQTRSKKARISAGLRVLWC